MFCLNVFKLSNFNNEFLTLILAFRYTVTTPTNISLTINTYKTLDS